VGYLTSFIGEITITPPIPFGKAKDSPFYPVNVDRDVMFNLNVQYRDTDEGTLTVRQAVALVPIMEGPYKGYSIIEHVQEAIDAYPDHEFTGRLDCEGDDSGDVWRLEIHDRKAVKVEAPHGS